MAFKGRKSGIIWPVVKMLYFMVNPVKSFKYCESILSAFIKEM